MNAKRLISLMLILISGSAMGSFNLGDAYSSTTGAIFPKSCLQDGADWKDYMTITNPHSILQFEQVQDSDELKDLLSVEGSVNFSNSLITASAEGAYVDSLDKSSRTTHIIYKIDASSEARLNLPIRTYTPITNGLSEATRPLYLSSKDEEKKQFFDTCGDSYIGSAKMTGSLLVDVSITFKNSAARETFDAAVKGEIRKPGMSLGVSAALEMTKENANSHVEIKISAIQLGGRMLGLTGMIKADENGNYAVSECGGLKGPSCADIMKSILKYGEHLADQYKTNADYYYTEPSPVSYTATFGRAGNPDADASKLILSDVEDDYQELKKKENLIKEFKARNDPGYKYLLAYDKTVLKPYLKVYENNAVLKQCAETLNLKSCGILIENIKTQKKKLGDKGGDDFYVANSRGEEMLDFIRDHNYTVHLLTLKNTAEKTPKFEGISCNLQPVYTPDVPDSLVLSCPAISSSSGGVTELPEDGIIMKIGADHKLSLGGFVYAVVEGKEKYCFKYPGTASGVPLPRSSPGVYKYKEPEIKYYHQIKLADDKGNPQHCPSAADSSAWTSVTDDNASEMSRRFTFTQNSLVTVYPNIIY